MQIQLLIPGLLWPTATLLGPAAGLALDGLATLLGRGTRSMHGFEPYDRQLARLYGLEGSALPLAALRRLGEAGPQPPADDGHWLCADPVNLSFAREHLLLQAFDDDQLPAEESAELVAALNESFTDLGRFEACTPTRWYLRLPRASRGTLYPLDDVVGRPVKHFLPEGDDARLWQRTMNEAQILLHNHPLSIGLARASQCATATPELSSALKQDTLVVIDSLRKPAQRLDLDSWRSGLEALERDWFSPLATALQRGRIDALRLIAPGDRGTLVVANCRSDRWKFWRKPHAFDALLKSIAPAPMALPDAPPPTAPHTDR